MEEASMKSEPLGMQAGTQYCQCLAGTRGGDIVTNTVEAEFDRRDGTPHTYLQTPIAQLIEQADLTKQAQGIIEWQ